MGRLTNLRSPLSTLPPRIARHTDAQGHSRKLEPWRNWYSLARWKRLRIAVFTRDLYTCQMETCGRLEGNTSLLVADHVIPHRGDPALFWDEGNVQTLCKPCHDKVKQREERLGRSIDGIGHNGGPPLLSGGMARPAWFRRVHVPLTIVCGPPGAGKSTYVRDRASFNDRVICFDEIAERVVGRSGAERPQASLTVSQIADVLRVRNEALGDLMRRSSRSEWASAWLILTEPKAEHRTWWADTLGAEIVVLATPADECRRRIARDAAAGDVRGSDAQRFVDAWWSDYQPAACDQLASPPGGRV